MLCRRLLSKVVPLVCFCFCCLFLFSCIRNSEFGIVDRGCLLLRSVVSFTRQNRIHIFLCISSISAFIRQINFDKLDSFLDFWTGFPRLCFCSGISWRIEQIVASALSRQQKGDQNYPEWIGTRPSQLPQPWMAAGCTGMTFLKKSDIEYKIYFRLCLHTYCILYHLNQILVWNFSFLMSIFRPFHK